MVGATSCGDVLVRSYIRLDEVSQKRTFEIEICEGGSWFIATSVYVVLFRFCHRPTVDTQTAFV